MTREAGFAAIADQLLGEPGVTEGTGFSPRLRSHERIFAMLAPDGLDVKLRAHRCAELVPTEKGQPFERAQGRPLKEWVLIWAKAERE